MDEYNLDSFVDYLESTVPDELREFNKNADIALKIREVNGQKCIKKIINDQTGKESILIRVNFYSKAKDEIT